MINSESVQGAAMAHDRVPLPHGGSAAADASATAWRNTKKKPFRLDRSGLDVDTAPGHDTGRLPGGVTAGVLAHRRSLLDFRGLKSGRDQANPEPTAGLSAS